MFVLLVSFFFNYSLVCRADIRLVELERKVRALEQEKILETNWRVIWLTLEDTLIVLIAPLTASKCWTFYKL